MARNKTNLLSFRQPRKSSSSTTGVDGEFTDAQQVTYYKNLFMRTIGGEFKNADDINAYVDFLSQFPQTPEVQIEIAKMQNEVFQSDNDQKAIFASVARMKDSLDDSLRQVMSEAGGDLNLLLSGQALVYSRFAEEADTFASETLKNYKSNTQLGDDYFDFKNELEQKSFDLTSLSAQLNDPTLAESFDPETVSLQITTNPSTGVINDIKFVPRGSVDKGYVETDIKMSVRDGIGAIPVSINAIENGSTEDGTQKRMARLGDIKLFGAFSKSAKNDSGIDGDYGLYTLKAQDDAGWTPFTQSRIERGRKDGLSASEFKMSGDDIAAGSVVRRGTRLFYTSESGMLQEFSGANYSEKVNNARAWLESIGDSSPDKVYYPRPISEEFLTKPDPVSGRASRIEAVSIASGSNPMAVPGAEPMAVAQPVAAEGTPGFFTERAKTQAVIKTSTPAGYASLDNKNRQNKPDEPKVVSDGKTMVNDLIEKGKSFFRAK